MNKCEASVLHYFPASDWSVHRLFTSFPLGLYRTVKWFIWFIHDVSYLVCYAPCTRSCLSPLPPSYHPIRSFPSLLSSDWCPCHRSAEPQAVALIDPQFARHLNLRRWVPLMCYSGWGVSFNRSKTESERNIRGPAFKAKLSLGVTRCQTSSRCGRVNKPEWNDERNTRRFSQSHTFTYADSRWFMCASVMLYWTGTVERLKSHFRALLQTHSPHPTEPELQRWGASEPALLCDL